MGSSSLRYRSFAALLIVGVTLLRIAYLVWWCPLDLATDEAHYWDWSRQLDWCYYSKGPLVAWLIRLSCACLGDSVLAVRLPAVVCGGLLLAGLYVLTCQVHRSDRLALGVVAMALTLPMVAAGSMLMTIDAPFIGAWMWALVFAHRAAINERLGDWLAAAGCILVGLLAKHTMVLFVPCFLLFLAATPALRDRMRRRGVWIMASVGALGSLPIVIWNACNGWLTFVHTQEHVGVADGLSWSWLGPARYVGTQLAVLLGFWSIVWVRAMWAHSPLRVADMSHRFLWWMSAPTFVFFGLFSFTNGGGGANWPAAGYLSGMVLAAGWLARELNDPRAWYRRPARAGMAMTALVGLLLTALLHQPTQLPALLLRIAPSDGLARGDTPIRRVDPTCRLRGWRHLAAEVDRLRRDLRARGIEPVLACERWSQTGEIAFYCAGHPTVHTLGMYFNDRPSQCDLWRPNPVADPDTFRGRTFLVVNMKAELLRDLFGAVEPTHVVEYREGNHVIAAWPVTVAHGFRPHP